MKNEPGAFRLMRTRAEGLCGRAGDLPNYRC